MSNNYSQLIDIWANSPSNLREVGKSKNAQSFMENHNLTPMM